MHYASDKMRLIVINGTCPCDATSLCLCRTLSATGTFDNTCVNTEKGGMIMNGKTEGFGEKPVPVLLSPSQISYGLSWPQTRASGVRSWLLRVYAMTRVKT
jgi:hypothetical protein